MKTSLPLIFIGALLPIAVILSWADLFFGLNIVEKRNENRVRAELPQFPKTSEEIKTLWPRFEIYFKDQFGLRDPLVILNSWIRLEVFQSTPTEDLVRGKDGWFFYAKQNNMELYRNLMPFSEAELQRSIETLVQRKTWADRNGIAYVFTVGPDSQTLNPEKLPDWAHKGGTKSRMDQLLEGAKAQGVPVIDLREPILVGKSLGPVSLMTDTHWNGYGAYIAYTQLIEHFRNVGIKVGEPVPVTEYKWSQLDSDGQDLAIVAGLQEKIRERSRAFDYAGSRKFEVVNREGLHFSTHNPEGNPVNLTCVCDSMAGNLYPHLGIHFKNTRIMWGYLFKAEDILKHKTNVLVDLVIERMLGWGALQNSEEFIQLVKQAEQ